MLGDTYTAIFAQRIHAQVKAFGEWNLHPYFAHNSELLAVGKLLLEQPIGRKIGGAVEPVCCHIVQRQAPFRIVPRMLYVARTAVRRLQAKSVLHTCLDSQTHLSDGDHRQ